MATYYDTPSTSEGIPKYYANWDANFWVVAPTHLTLNMKLLWRI